MIKIVPDKEGRLTQWDLNRKVIVTGYEGVAEVHFASPGDDHGAYVVKLVDGQAEIPNILLTMAGTINVYVYPADRTVFATTLWVMAREKPDDYVYIETEVLDWRTLDEKIGDLAELTTTAKENLVAAINEAATKGMASIYMRVEKGYIEYSGDGVNWKQLIAIAELKGEKGDKGDPGSDATVDIVTPTAESTDTQAASAKAVWDMLGGGGSGTDISLGLTGAAVGDIVKVKAVDASGKPTEWEAAGWRTIAEIVTTDQANQYELTEDSEGNPLNLSEVILRYAYGDAGYEYESVWINGTQVSYRHAGANNNYQTFYLKKVGKHLYGIDTNTTQNNISGMNTGLKACGLALNLFPNGEKINKIKFGSTYAPAYVGVTVTVLGR